MFEHPLARARKWDRRFMALAEHISSWSRDPSTKVGAVIARENKFICSGYNGFAAGIDDDEERYANRDFKLKLVIHAEINAILFADRDLTGYSIYTWPFCPCSRCASHIIQVGIKRCVAPYSDNPRWLDDFVLTTKLFREANITFDILDAPVGFTAYDT
jgi:dCMP deaminase